MKNKLVLFLKILLWLLAILLVILLLGQKYIQVKVLLDTWGVLTISALLILYSAKSVVTGGFYARGYNVKKEEHPGIYYFCVLLFFLTGTFILIHRLL